MTTEHQQLAEDTAVHRHLQGQVGDCRREKTLPACSRRLYDSEMQRQCPRVVAEITAGHSTGGGLVSWKQAVAECAVGAVM